MAQLGCLREDLHWQDNCFFPSKTTLFSFLTSEGGLASEGLHEDSPTVVSSRGCELQHRAHTVGHRRGDASTGGHDGIVGLSS